ncbi:MAG: DNA integrity scanning protein DisA nucleotide-binding domain protein [Candidatus Micrarchaeota archaeon]|nr:DNA integrity scanning protein DisA nucleotide-binding domain protein [Candidatus Micrarchaeota archaeon]
MGSEGNALEKKVIRACTDMAIRTVKGGSLFVIELEGAKKKDYYTKVFGSLRGANGKPLNVIGERNRPIIEQLAMLDGATIVDARGNIREFGVTLKRQRTFLRHGKRHAFALGTSALKDIVCIVASEEDNHVRLFRGGVCMVDMDALTRTPSGLKGRVAEVLDTPLSKILVASGIATSILTLNPIPAIVTITGSSVIVSYGFDRIKRLFTGR